MSRLLAVAVLAIAILVACGPSEKPASRYSLDASAKGEPVMETHCYVRLTPGDPIVVDGDTLEKPVDSLYIRLDLLGELANGVYNWLPQEQDPTTGSFQGSIADGVVTAVYTYTQEGETGKQEVLFKVEDGQLRVGTGEMEEAEGVHLFKDKSQVSYGEPIPEVNCK